MKIAILFATAAMVATTNLPLAAQQPAATTGQSAAASAAQTQADQSTAATAQTGRNGSSAKISEAAYSYMRPINCELAGKLDSKSAKVGDLILAKITQNLVAADGTVIPKGAKLVGHITSVQAHTSGQADSSLSIAFDRVEWSGGHSLPVHSVLQAVAPPVNTFPTTSMDSSDSLAGSTGGAGSRGMGGSRGGMPGGTAGAAGSAAGNMGTGIGANASNLGSAAGGTLRSAGQTTSDLAGSAVASTGVSAQTSASMGAHPTGVPGVMLAGDSSGATAGTLSASKRNVHLDSGTQLTVAVSAAVSQ